MMSRRASCSCGQLAVMCLGEPVRVSICHCLACQQRTGSVFAVQARFPRARVSATGRAAEHVRVGDEGGRALFRFCPECGSTVFWDCPDDDRFVAVAVGAFADPGFQAPTVSVYEVRRHSWVNLPDTLVERWD